MTLNPRNLLLAVTILLVACAVACTESGSGGDVDSNGKQESVEARTASIAGQITVPQDKDAFGVTVYAEGTSHIAITGSAGKFVLSGLVPGSYTLRAMRADLASVRLGSLTITEEDLSAPQPVGQFDPVAMESIEPPSASTAAGLGSITGSVATAVELDREGVLVMLNQTRQSSVTDASGSYSFPWVSPGSYSLTFVKSGFREVTIAVVVRPGGTVTAPEATLVPATAEDIGAIASGAAGNRVIFGQVVMLTADGESSTDYSNVRVALEGTGFQATPDAAGRYEIRGLQPRPYTVAANAPGFALEQKFRVDLAPVANANVDLTLIEDTSDTFGLGGLFGRVELDDDPPEGPAGVQVALAGEDFVTFTDDDGNWEIIGVEPGVYTVVATLTGYRDALVQGMEVVGGTPTEVDDIILELDVEVPRVVFTEPKDGTGDVAIEQPLLITVQFSVPMDVASVREAISIQPETELKVTALGQPHALGGTDLYQVELEAVPGTGKKSVRYGTRYKLTIDRSAESTEGVSMRQDYELNFTTDYALIIATNPEDGEEDAIALFDRPVEIYFNAPIDPESIDRDDIRISPDLPSQPNIHFRRDPDTGWSKLNISGYFEFDTEYKLSIRRSALTITGDRVRNLPYDFSFKTRELHTYDEFYGTDQDSRDAKERERDRK